MVYAFYKYNLFRINYYETMEESAENDECHFDDEIGDNILLTEKKERSSFNLLLSE